MTEISDRWLSVKEISVYLGVSTDTVYRWIESSNLPTHRLGRLWKFKASEIDDWIKAGGASNKERSMTRNK